MKFFEDLTSQNNRPLLIPSHKQTERKLLSIFMALLEISVEARAAFLAECGYRSGRICSYESFMEVTYKGAKYPDVRPDGLVVCKRGKTSWAAFIEAKAEKSEIRPDQIQEYAQLANLLDVPAIVTISNEFARQPHELPYHLSDKSRKGAEVYHFAWADIRTVLELLHTSETLAPTEAELLKQVLAYFWHDSSGIKTYDAMPAAWPDFVESASTALGFNQNVKGLSEIVYGWQQERRDLCSKLTHALGGRVELRHKAGVRSTDADRIKTDKSDLADNYMLNARYYFPATKTTMDVNADLRACRTTVAMEISPPENKGAKAVTTWLAKLLQDSDDKITLLFDWPGRSNDVALEVSEFLAEPSAVSEGRKSPPKSIHIIMSQHGVRRFKSRKIFIEDLETTAFQMLALGQRTGWVAI